MNHTHIITLHERFYEPIKRGDLTGLAVSDSRAVQRGDFLTFCFCDDDGIDKVNNGLEDRAFEVTFVYSSAGVANGYSLVSFRIMPF